METPITLGLLMNLFNAMGAIVGITFTFAAGSAWYWKALWMFVLISSVTNILIHIFV